MLEDDYFAHLKIWILEGRYVLGSGATWRESKALPGEAAQPVEGRLSLCSVV